MREFPVQQIGQAGAQSVPPRLRVAWPGDPRTRRQDDRPLPSHLLPQVPAATGRADNLIVETAEEVVLVAAQPLGEVALVEVVAGRVLGVEGLILGVDEAAQVLAREFGAVMPVVLLVEQ